MESRSCALLLALITLSAIVETTSAAAHDYFILQSALGDNKRVVFIGLERGLVKEGCEPLAKFMSPVEDQTPATDYREVTLEEETIDGILANCTTDEISCMGERCYEEEEGNRTTGLGRGFYIFDKAKNFTISAANYVGGKIANGTKAVVDKAKALADNIGRAWHGIIPNTKWCGTGDIAKHDDDLGSNVETDMCCRAHDKCDLTISKGETKYNLTNTGIFTKLSCECEIEFDRCLGESSEILASWIKSGYNRVILKQCIQKSYPKYCKTWKKKVCLAYEENTKEPPIYTWMEKYGDANKTKSGVGRSIATDEGPNVGAENNTKPSEKLTDKGPEEGVEINIKPKEQNSISSDKVGPEEGAEEKMRPSEGNSISTDKDPKEDVEDKMKPSEGNSISNDKGPISPGEGVTDKMKPSENKSISTDKDAAEKCPKKCAEDKKKPIEENSITTDKDAAEKCPKKCAEDKKKPIEENSITTDKDAAEKCPKKCAEDKKKPIEENSITTDKDAAEKCPKKCAEDKKKPIEENSITTDKGPEKGVEDKMKPIEGNSIPTDKDPKEGIEDKMKPSDGNSISTDKGPEEGVEDKMKPMEGNSISTDKGNEISLPAK